MTALAAAAMPPPVIMLRAFALALAQLADPRVLRIWLKSMAVAAGLFALLGGALWWGLHSLLTRYVSADGLAEVAAIAIALLGAWLLWRIVALAALQFFADDVVLVVEQRHYPAAAARARRLGWRAELGRALAGSGRALLYNFLALPLALILAPTGIGVPLVFLLVNAVLLGRELQDMVWLRHRPAKHSAPPLSAAERLMLGGAVALLLTVPFANFAAAFVGAACAAHLIHRKDSAGR